MGQYLTAAGKETSDKAAAAVDPKTGKPVPNAARNIWVTATALTTALSASWSSRSGGCVSREDPRDWPATIASSDSPAWAPRCRRAQPVSDHRSAAHPVAPR
jgi:hypothetical protein